MSVNKPAIPKGTRDFTPAEMIRRNYIFDTIREIFEYFGYQPLETPAMENLDTLLGKYGDEGDKLLFRILNSGNFLDPLNDEDLRSRNIHKISSMITEKGLRYDLTVPFARFVVQHQHELVFPFKRYQMQPVWRADRPQKGRYREFYQCDVDVIGSNSLLYETELFQIVDSIFSRFGMEVLILFNHRQILTGIAEILGVPEKLTALTVAIDKIEKAGLENVNQELLDNGIPQEAVDRLQPLLTMQGMDGKIQEKLDIVSGFLNGSEAGKKGIEELQYIKDYLETLGLKNRFAFDPKLARGLNYYTGTIIEVKALNVSIGSICGGGRYDNLTGIFGLPGVSGVGISFGADRIFDALNELNLFPEHFKSTTQVLFINFGSEEERYCMPLLAKLRASGIPSEIYPEPAKLKKQMEYSNRKNVQWVILAGKEEMEKEMVTVRNMSTGEQKQVGKEEMITIIN
ncbi:MAG: histidine--tRNA ligase [Bacteroidota bacterium]|nr:histidine--tRNA ligase [Bacteroidota bacterium]